MYDEFRKVLGNAEESLLELFVSLESLDRETIERFLCEMIGVLIAAPELINFLP